MHFEILVEDQSGAAAVEHLAARILGEAVHPEKHTFRTIPYRGIGRLPKDLRSGKAVKARLLLSKLPALLRGYGNTFRQQEAALVVVVDLDRENCQRMKARMLEALGDCQPRPTALFRIAIEEIEAWYLGSPDAIKEAYPKANERALRKYKQDSICGTWEALADAIRPGGSKSLLALSYREIGEAKREWAEAIGPLIDVVGNRSPSFQAFRTGMLRLANSGQGSSRKEVRTR